MIRSTDTSRQRTRTLRAVIAFLLVAAAVATGATLASSGSAGAASSHATPAPPCQNGDSCVVIPCSTSPCPTLEAGPVTNLGPAQYVFVHLYNFPVGDLPAVWYCSAVQSLATGPPVCSVAPGPEQLPVFADGTAFVSYQVLERANDGSDALVGEVPGKPTDTGSFYCDDGADPCALDIFDSGLDGQTTPDTNNTAVVPLNFVPSSSGCPKGTVVNSESDFGIEGLISQVAPASCSGTAPAIPVNTSLNSLSAVQDLVSDQVQIAFTDDPLGADEQTALSGSGTHYAYIPVAASADVIGFAADESETTNPFVLYPDTSFQLTPNMVAGLTSMQYAAPGTADGLPAVTCPNPVPGGSPKNVKPCPAMEAINAKTGFLPPTIYWGVVRSDNAGITDEIFNWLCAAQDHTVSIGGVADTEAKTAAQVFAAAAWANPGQKTKCPTGDQFPALSGTGNWAAESNPAFEAKDVQNELANAAPSRDASFAVMNWYEALYYGLNVASLQNASGAFVTPSAQSVDAALTDASVDSSTGVLTNSYTNSSDAAAYPTPAVIYAVVPTDPPSGAGAIGTELRSILAVTTAAESTAVPGGLLPLPSKLATEANATVNADFPAPAGSGGSSQATTSSGGSGSQPSRSTPSSAGSRSGGVSGGPTTFGGTTNGTTGITVSSSPPKSSPTTTTPLGTNPQKAQKADFLGLVPPGGRWLLIALLVAGAVAIFLGPAILGLLGVRRRPGDGDAHVDGGGPPDSVPVT
jgi:hypothetical protein